MKYQGLIKDYITASFFVFMIAFTFNTFFYSFEMVIGGSSGIAILVNFITGIKPSIIILFIHIGVLIVGYFLLGWTRVSKSIYGSLIYPVFVELSSPIANFVMNLSIGSEHLFIIIVLGSVIYGWAQGNLYKIDYTAGGSDVINQIVNKFTGITMGTSNFIVNSFIVLAGGFILGWVKVLYAILILYVIGIASDRAQLGSYSNKAFYIITKKENEVSDFIKKTLGINVTSLESVGGFEGKEGNIIMCIISNNDYYHLKEGIEEIDPNSLFIITHAYKLEERS